MKVIDESNIKAVCVESRPHPDFCGPKWWADMDVILDEARKRGMKVWILDDSHFPTGYANGAMAEQPDELCRQSVSCRTYRCSGGETLCIGKEELFHPDPFQPTQIESYIGEKEPRHFDDDRLLRLFAVPFAAQGESGRESAKSLAEKVSIYPDISRKTVFHGRYRKAYGRFMPCIYRETSVITEVISI